MKITRAATAKYFTASLAAIAGLLSVLTQAQTTAPQTAPATSTAQIAPATQRANLLPNSTRWQELPGDIHYVLFDNAGKPWFEAAGKATLDEIRAQVEQASTLKAPAIRGAAILLFDSKNRIWLLPHEKPSTLLCYDPAAHKWTEHTAVQDPDLPPDSHENDFRGLALESKTGIIYITANRGVYTLSADKWNYQPTYQINIEKNLYYNPGDKYFNAIQLSQSPDGTVYAWSRWGMPGERSGTLGLWRHDGKTWRQLYTAIGYERKPGQICQVVPLGNDRLFVTTGMNSESSYIFPAGPALEKQAHQAIKDLSDDNGDVEANAEKTLHDLGPTVIPNLQAAIDNADPEPKARLNEILHGINLSPHPLAMLDGWKLVQAHVVGRDSQNNTYIFSNSSLKPDGTRSTTVNYRYSPEGKLTPAAPWMLIRPEITPTRRGHTVIFEYNKGFSLVENDKATPLTGPTDTAFTRLLGEDDQGRFYIMSEPPGGDFPPLHIAGHLVLLDPHSPDIRPTLPNQLYPGSFIGGGVALDTNGRIWAQFNPREHPFLSYFDAGEWHDVAVPPNAPKKFKYIGFIQPLNGGGLVACSDDSAAAFILTDNQWRAYPSIDKLVETEFDTLQKNLSNESRKSPRDFLHKDSAGNIWACAFDNLRVYTGKQWLSLKDSPDKPLANIIRIYPADAPNMLLAGMSDLAYAQVKDGKILLSRPGVLKADVTPAYFGNEFGLHVDSHNRAWLRVANQKVIYIDDNGPHDVPGTPDQPILEDHAGRIWFLAPLTRKISVLLPDGRYGEFPGPNLDRGSCMAEDKDHNLWLTTSKGLARYTVSDTPEKISLTKTADYTSGIPTLNIYGLWPDHDGNLWLGGNGLCRVDIKTPATTTSAPATQPH